MTTPLFGKDDLIPKLPSRITIQASASLNGLLRIKPKQIPTSQILSTFQTAINRASQRITTDLKQALDQALRSNVWQTPGGRADIYDTGELLSSGTVRVTQNGVSISYDAPYAALVHYGGYINPYGNQSTKVYLPPRPWVDSVLRGSGPIPAFDFERYYREEIERAFR